MAKKKKQQGAPKAQPAKKAEPVVTRAKPAPMKRSTRITFIVIMIVMVLVFVWKWVEVIRDGYFDAFVTRGENTEDAVDGFLGLSLSEAESAGQLALQLEWDAYATSRLRDEVPITAEDGVSLHAYYYDEGSELTVVVLQRFDLDGTDDFLAGSWLYEYTGCNFLLIDQRAHGESGGDYFGYGYLEQWDLACWLDWAEESLHSERFVLWGEGSGANTILFAAANGLLPESVCCIVAESPYASLHELASRNIWKFYTVPALLFLDAIEYKLAHSEAGYTIEDLELAALLAESSCELPAIFLCSAEDSYILPEWSESVYEAYSGEKTLISGGGSHGTVYAACAAELQALLAEYTG